MDWLKDVFLDIIVTLFIASAVFLEIEWMYWIIIVYTGILLLTKAIVLLADDALQLIRKTETEAPKWVNNLLYGINTLVLLVNAWWYVGGAWVLIWLLSYMAQHKLERSRAASAS